MAMEDSFQTQEWAADLGPPVTTAKMGRRERDARRHLLLSRTTAHRGPDGRDGATWGRAVREKRARIFWKILRVERRRQL